MEAWRRIYWNKQLTIEFPFQILASFLLLSQMEISSVIFFSKLRGQRFQRISHYLLKNGEIIACEKVMNKSKLWLLSLCEKYGVFLAFISENDSCRIQNSRPIFCTIICKWWWRPLLWFHVSSFVSANDLCRFFANFSAASI